MAGHYRLGPKLPATVGNMWDLIRAYVAEAPGLSHSRLLAKMVARGANDWPVKVLRDQSVQGVGSERWCNGYINGAVREGYFIRD